MTSFPLRGQSNYHILFEGEYPIDSDSTLYLDLDWYGFFVRDSIHEDDLIERVQIQLEYVKNYDGVLWKTKPTIISTSSSRKSLFLLGVKRGEQLDFKSAHRCGATYKYSLQETSLLPGRCVNWGFPTMSCSHLSILAFGSVKKTDKWNVSEYQIIAERSTFMEKEGKVQELTHDIFGRTKLPMKLNHPLLAPYVYAMGDFDFDAETDFILWHDGMFYLYLTRHARPQDIVALSAKSKLKMMVDGGYGSMPDVFK
jgi:hypothetical protein